MMESVVAEDKKEKICPVCWAFNRADASVCRACGAGISDVAAGERGGDTGASSSGGTTSHSRFESAEFPDSGGIQMTGPAAGSLLAERYRIVHEIARGGMGIVYLAEDTYLDNLRVAIKILPRQIPPDATAEKRLKREALTAMALSHDNIMRLYSFDQHEGQSFLVMEYINGPPLDDLVAQKGRLTPAEAALFMRPTCEALQYAHEKGVVHRDIKPANIMLALPEDSRFRSGKKAAAPRVSPNAATRIIDAKAPAPPRQEEPAAEKPDLSQFTYEDAMTAKVKLCDFGIAQQVRQTMTRLTGTSLIGSPVYMAPEQLQGGKVDHRTDIYALGTTVYELLSGVVPFDGPIHSLTYQIVEKDPPPVPGVDESLNNVVMKCLAKDPRNRWQSCREFAQALEDALEGKAVEGYVPDRDFDRRASQMKDGSRLSSSVTRGDRADKTKKTDRRVADLRVAKLSFETKLFGKALEEMKQYRLLHGDSDELLTFGAECVDKLVSQREFSHAHEFCQFVALIDQENPNVYLTLGRVQRVLGRTTDAERSLRLAMIYGADEQAVEKELRGTLAELKSGALTGMAGRPVQMTAARIAGYVAGLVLAVGLTLVLAYFAGRSFSTHNQILSCVAGGAVLLVISGSAGIILTSVFAGRFDEVSDRLTKTRQYLARHGYAGGWLGIGVIGAAASFVATRIYGEPTYWPVFLAVFAITAWAGSTLYSWHVVYSALSARQSPAIP
jgi:serine/threonine protein kinase/ribosomal protein L40E